MIPWSCDTILPTAERYASLKYRRCALFTRLDYGDAAELVAFLHDVPLSQARYVFHWKPGVLPHVKRLYDHMKGETAVKAMVVENARAATRDDGLAVLAAMRDGGWKQGPIPRWSRMAITDLHNSGMTWPAIAEATGLTIDQAQFTARRDARMAARAAASRAAERVASGEGVVGLVAK